MRRSRAPPSRPDDTSQQRTGSPSPRESADRLAAVPDSDDLVPPAAHLAARPEGRLARIVVAPVFRVRQHDGLDVDDVHVAFFFQAEDGIRDGTVTGVQTCALPI